jgi:hypothetical protein
LIPFQIAYTHYVHPANIDIYVSASYYVNEGNNRFELFLTKRMYDKLRGVNQAYSQPKNPIFVDCGTNIGTHSMFFAAIGVRTHSFEPMPKNVALLHCSAAANPSFLDHWSINAYGLSDHDSDGGCMVRARVSYVSVRILIVCCLACSKLTATTKATLSST